MQLLPGDERGNPDLGKLSLAALPITLVYIALSRHFIAGITQGAVK